MKKMFFVLIITVLSMFMMAAVVSADGNRYRNFQGTYEMSLKGNGLNSTLGFTQSDNGFFKPVANSVVWGSTDTAYGTFVFNRDGTGWAEGMNYAFDLPPGNLSIFGGPIARNNRFDIEFEYEISPDGLINLYITFPPILATVEMTGKVSKNRNIMTLTNSNSLLVFVGSHETLFTATRVLIRVLNDVEDE